LSHFRFPLENLRLRYAIVRRSLGRARAMARLQRHLVPNVRRGKAAGLLPSLGLPGVEYSRGYVQHWLCVDSIPEKSAQRIFQAVDRVLRAGTSHPSTHGQ
jgi:hypothetical protein